MNAKNSFIIQTEGLSKAYKGVQALKPLDLQVREHSICGCLDGVIHRLRAVALFPRRILSYT